MMRVPCCQALIQSLAFKKTSTAALTIMTVSAMVIIVTALTKRLARVSSSARLKCRAIMMFFDPLESRQSALLQVENASAQAMDEGLVMGGNKDRRTADVGNFQ